MARPVRPVNRPLRITATLGLAVWLGACSFFQAAPIPRGNRIDEEQLSQITPGVQTRRDVQALLGSPSFAGTFNDANWYYLSAVSRIAPGRRMQIEDRRVVAIAFDNAGVVQGVRTLTEADGQDIAMVDRETPTPGNDRSLLQSLFGNIGRFGGAGGPAASNPNAPGTGGRL
ncbi:outer membrane protein assembly factor BamE [Plastoroseomonas hellenica]|uniref:Outer membrane protein assembly factor BamE n=1 Tax=Plastoroseomonas hellenica TaxID=2687306 RepID=A0ABS5EZL5_9PROT|nr:outer membrane protein assembly factor BamE [Plastoroseomonas hellenica]MBR0643429.1 outer membrane protein assembly factor BamE [Plastoroseomonas hellenica]MBR0665719.1 outer membrane protein assembly factor BamE [Plastoroseomonas hellenica]